MFRSLRSRLLLTYFLVIGVALLVVAVVTLAYLARNPSQTAQARLRLQFVSEAIARRAVALPDEPDIDFRGLAQRLDQSYSVRVIILGTGGEILVDSQSDSRPALILRRPAGLGDELNPAVKITRDANEGEWLYLSRSLNHQYRLVLATPRPKITFFAALRTRSDDILSPLRQSALAAFALALILAIWIARWVSAPLQRMAGAARDVAGGQYRAIPLEGPQEVQELGNAFNEMTAQVRASQQSQRDFIANVSHELKTPLTSIQGFSQAILDGTADSPDAHHGVARIILDETERMNRMVLDLLELARLDAGTINFQRDTLDLRAVLSGVVGKLSPQAASAQVELHFSADELPELIGDADRLAQVFINLLDNAIQHTPPDGDIKVSAEMQDDQILVSIADTGPGLPDDEAARIFERFYQVDKSRPGGKRRGVGLGLAIAREIILAHDGEISVITQTGQGSVFVVKLPSPAATRKN
ncbi:MAG: HAMP domain-containing sensor histidine kinase [Chloroflexota bacterium]